MSLEKLKSTVARFLPPVDVVLWWFVSLALFCAFDLMWCVDTGSFLPLTTYSSTLIFVPLWATVFALPSLLRKRIPQFIVLELVAFILVANLMYANTYFMAIPLSCYFMAGNLEGFGSSVLDSIKWYYFILLIIPAIPLFIRLKPQKRGAAYVATYLCVLALLCAAAYLSLRSKGGLNAKIEEMYASAVEQSAVAPVYGVFSGLIYDMTAGGGNGLGEADKAEIDAWLAERERIMAADTAAVSAPEKKKVAFLMVESLESWPIGAKVAGRELTPRLNEIVGDSLVYYNPNVVTQTKAGRSIDGQLLYIAGMLPPERGVYSSKLNGHEFPTLPKAMKEIFGASTYLFSPDKESVWNQKPVANAFGFDNQFYEETWTIGDGEMATDGYILDVPLIEQSVSLFDSIAGAPENYFAMWITHSLHNNFTFIPESEKVFTAAEIKDKTLLDYANSAHYTDKAIGLFVDRIKARPDADEILIVIVGDHEALANHRSRIVGSGEYDYVSGDMLTPLILINGRHAGRDEKVMGQVDVYSTLLDETGLAGQYGWKGLGISVFSPAHPGSAIDFKSKTVGPGSGLDAHLRGASRVSELMLRDAR